MGASRPSQKPASLATDAAAGTHQLEQEKQQPYFNHISVFSLTPPLSSSLSNFPTDFILPLHLLYIQPPPCPHPKTWSPIVCYVKYSLTPFSLSLKQGHLCQSVFFFLFLFFF